MTINLAPAIRDDVTDFVANYLTDGYIDIFDADAVQLVRITLSGGFGASVDGTAELTTVPRTGTAGETGVAVSFTAFSSADDAVFSGSVGLAGSGQPAIISDTSITTGDTISLNSLTLTAPA